MRVIGVMVAARDALRSRCRRGFPPHWSQPGQPRRLFVLCPGSVVHVERNTGNYKSPVSICCRGADFVAIPRQNSSMISHERNPQRYRPLNCLKSAMQERKAFMDVGIRCCNGGEVQFNKTAMMVLPAWVNWWMT